MKLKDLKIGNQLLIGFGAMMIFVIILGVVSYRQSEKIHQQTELIYNHPLKVQHALGALKVDLLNIRVVMRDLLVSKTEAEKQNILQQIAINEADIHNQFDIIRKQYLGPQKDIDEASEAYIKWDTSNKENIRLLVIGVSTCLLPIAVKNGASNL